MTAAELAALREAITTIGKYVAEQKALIAILEEGGPMNWKSRLGELRQTPEYKVIAMRYEVAARQIEVDANFETLARLFQQSGEGKLPN